MNEQILEDAKDIVKKGHFLLTSGNHSHVYINKDAILYHKEIRDIIVNTLVEKLQNAKEIDIIISPGNAGVPWGSFIADRLFLPFVYTEKIDGEIHLRKSFENALKNKRVLIVEDIISTGSSIKKVVDILKYVGVKNIYAAAIWDRKGIDNVVAVFKQKVENWKPEDCPLCKENIPLVDPKSDEMVKMDNFNREGITIQIKNDDRLFVWDLDNNMNQYPVPYKSKIFNGTFKEFKQINFGDCCKNVGLRISRDWQIKLEVKLKMCNNQFFFLDNEKYNITTINLKEL